MPAGLTLAVPISHRLMQHSTARPRVAATIVISPGRGIAHCRTILSTARALAWQAARLNSLACAPWCPGYYSCPQGFDAAMLALAAGSEQSCQLHSWQFEAMDVQLSKVSPALMQPYLRAAAGT